MHDIVHVIKKKRKKGSYNHNSLNIKVLILHPLLIFFLSICGILYNKHYFNLMLYIFRSKYFLLYLKKKFY